MYISLEDIGLFVGILVLIAIGVLLIVTLLNINKLVLSVNKKINDNEENIQEMINNMNDSARHMNELTGTLKKNKYIFDEKIPESINNIHSLSGTLKNTGAKVDHSLDLVNSSIVKTASAVEDNTQDILTYLKIFGESVKVIFEVFKKK